MQSQVKPTSSNIKSNWSFIDQHKVNGIKHWTQNQAIIL